MMPEPQLSPREHYYARLRALGLSEHSLKVRHGITLEPRTQLTETVAHKGEPIGFISPMRGGWRGHVADPSTGRRKKHEHSPFSSRQMGAAAVAVKAGRVVLPQRQAPSPAVTWTSYAR